MEIGTKEVIRRKYEIKVVWPMVLLASFILSGILIGFYCMIFENVSGSTYTWSECLMLKYFLHCSIRKKGLIALCLWKTFSICWDFFKKIFVPSKTHGSTFCIAYLCYLLF